VIREREFCATLQLAIVPELMLIELGLRKVAVAGAFDDPVTTEARCYAEPLRRPARVPWLSDASPVSSSSAAWRMSRATASRS